MSRKSCAAIQADFSAYLDGALSGREMQAIAHHIDGCDSGSSTVAGCEDCARELAAWRLTQDALATLGPARAPADLALRLRVAISHEQARRDSRLLDRFWPAWDNAIRPMLVQISAGFAGTVVLVGGIVMLLGMVAAPREVLANDEPLGAMTAPHYLYSTVAPAAIVAPQDADIVVEASVDSTGRVYDFSIVAGPHDERVRTQIANQLLGSVFQPASAFGVPIRGRAIVTYFGISVRG